jgi:hypothetical protein
MAIKLLDNITFEEKFPMEKVIIDDHTFDLEEQSGTY